MASTWGLQGFPGVLAPAVIAVIIAASFFWPDPLLTGIPATGKGRPWQQPE